MNTKWYNENHKNTNTNAGIRYTDTPIPIAASRFEGEGEGADKPKVYCPECRYDTVIRDGSSYYCNHCRNTFDVEVEQEDKVQPGVIVESENMDDNAETLVSTMTPDPDAAFYNKDKIEPKGTFKVLQDRGLKITSYTETDGAGRPLKRNRWSQ